MTAKNSSFEENSSQNGKRTVLVVDDEDLVLSMVYEILKDDYNIVRTNSARDSISRIKQDRNISCVVMDIKMPDMDGITAARRIHEENSELPVIFHTGYPGDYEEDEIDRREKPYEYILKGDSISRLTRAVRRAVEHYLLKQKYRRLQYQISRVNFRSRQGLS